MGDLAQSEREELQATTEGERWSARTVTDSNTWCDFNTAVAAVHRGLGDGSALSLLSRIHSVS